MKEIESERGRIRGERESLNKEEETFFLQIAEVNIL